MELKKTGTWYKFEGMMHIRYSDGTIWSVMPSPIDFPNNSFENIPDGIMPGQTLKDYRRNYKALCDSAKFEILDFGKE